MRAVEEIIKGGSLREGEAGRWGGGQRDREGIGFKFIVKEESRLRL